jgi:hypothetical protein
MIQDVTVLNVEANKKIILWDTAFALSEINIRICFSERFEWDPDIGTSFRLWNPTGNTEYIYSTRYYNIHHNEEQTKLECMLHAWKTNQNQNRRFFWISRCIVFKGHERELFFKALFYSVRTLAEKGHGFIHSDFSVIEHIDCYEAGCKSYPPISIILNIDTLIVENSCHTHVAGNFFLSWSPLPSS